MKLKKVEVTQSRVKEERPDTVESILRRRIAMEQSSSDDSDLDSSGSSSGPDSWDSEEEQ